MVRDNWGVHMALALAASKESSILGFLAAPAEVPVSMQLSSVSLPN